MPGAAASANGLWDRRGRVATAKGAGFAGFCGWLLEAMGYSNQVSPPGADRGVDIAASEDALGVRQPLLRVQCKSGGSAVGSPDVQALNGTLGTTDQFEGSRRNLTISTPPRHHSSRDVS